MNRTTSGNPGAFPPAGGKAPRFGRLAGAIAAALAAAVLTACSPAPQGLSFAARDAGLIPRQDGQVMSFANGGVLLAAPESYCFDRRSSAPEDGGGFALIAHCSRLEGRGWFGARKAAVLTASIGPASQNALAPRASDIAAMFPGARLLESREDQLLPLVRLEFPQAVAKGASPVHWRGAFVLDRHLIALALYAPEGSRALGSHGAALLNEVTHRTLEASTLPPLEQAQAAPPAAAAPALRPRPRPAAPETADQAAGPRKIRGLGRRIAGLFQ
ncbi:hypothetical protein [Leisingera caerulea]|uniref:hypothetical protein n=1 Tax=Leisingera caerulea TaxID=506591 RepID=UPI0021A72FA3|nr:hypothetical protein [Leisingera caerulea]UWQ83208.1 hypothetical protein K3726_16330 [Leisingera caerulea]